MLRALAENRLNVLAVAVPITWVLAATAPESPWLFLTAAISLVLGLSFFVGGLGRHVQKFHRTAATNTAAMLFLAVVALVMPAVFDLSVYGTLAAQPAAIDRLSFWTALILIGAYGGSLVYAFTANRDLFRPGHEKTASQPRLSTSAALALLAIATALTTIQAEILVRAME